MKRRNLLLSPLGLAAAVPGGTVRGRWVALLDKLARPVMENLAREELKKRMPLRAGRPEWAEQRRVYAPLEAFGRTACGIAPWLALARVPESERALQAEYRRWAIAGLARAVDPGSPDYMPFTTVGQSLVDAAFLSLALLRWPDWYRALGAGSQKQLREALLATRKTQPGFNNWLLFSAMVEMFLQSIGEDWDKMRVDYALRQHEQWYKGDGVYGDGPAFHWDYYNSFVIQPFLVAICERLGGPMRAQVEARALRYAAVQERLIGVDGTFPVLGRSMCYRTGVFHHLADQALRGKLPVEAGAVRGALTAVLDRVFPDGSPNFDKEGWLEIGFMGRQPAMADSYINTGSLYLSSFILLPLGLAEDAPFWAGPEAAWTSARIWKGENVEGDHALR
ncbi:MAG: DUF2264 domain-containing protein [Bryobacterales bacterium]|nr:DUF2264 domain-containing protein [Bryobacterales bacterium]